MPKAKDKSTMDLTCQNFNESPLEAQSRKDADFESIEAKLPKRWSRTEMFFIDKGTSFLGSKNPFGRKACPKDNIVWLLDNTAYKPIKPGDECEQPWQAEFVACFFREGRKDLTKYVCAIADLVGLDGKAGDDAAARKRIEERVKPFVMAISPARTIQIKIPSPCDTGIPHKRVLGPSNPNGISSQTLLTGGANDADGKTVVCTSDDDTFPGLKSKTRFVGPEGWGIISDIDDTVKVTMTPSPTGILHSTFADVPRTTPGMPEFYKVLNESFKSPAWFYLSASPYNLYPFLHDFLDANYPQGTIILRDASWMYLGGLLQSLTQGVKEYKTDRIEKIQSWLPNRKFVCIGDSTQSDPEAYAAMYAKYPDWIKAIYIRKVTEAPHMENKNKNQRFIDAFKDVPDQVWRVFVDPKELADHIKHVAGTAHAGVVGNVLSL
ncbi:uncharacterized protein Z520_01605 [Fonsecaea multimorphosa CBS 102226]|uniref:Phosphatidate phosphatase APP1 catalytic domain-containing protein n=1 Tax=Fonsecaea multimorphosa CBS 102226 TaxID=1442371 RepID=A0A0D2KAV7_9EURO|nr:uncharacterized protein Z520_01605 [Fonsecaea multimorphosa CBS 102226]KIY03138.1 hypothetical protein Z520_01605 [Fonsecaea multimorphosa CBS 102226]OAL30383.1 hypothetical protein AYO22_01581 [Fonsecaea multimorphosa]